MKDFLGENEAILNDWRQSNKGYNEHNFAEDGIMNKGNIVPGEGYVTREPSDNKAENTLWATADLRILFLTKDQNSSGEEAWDVRAEYGRNSIGFESIQYAFFRNLMYLLYGICHTTEQEKAKYDFTNQDAMDFFDAFPFARINVKKEAGTSSLANDTLKLYLERDAIFIERQIKNLNPDIIICCGYSESVEKTGNLLLNFLNSHGYDFKSTHSNNWIYYDERKNKIAINSWHLSARISSETFYHDMTDAYFQFIKSHPQFLLRIKENRLFRRWKDTIDAKNGSISKFCKDGIINPCRWFKQNKRILFLLKDINNEEGNLNEWSSLTDWLAENPSKNKEAFLRKRASTWGNIAKWIYGITHIEDSPDWDTASAKCGNATGRYNQIQKVAVINLKKQPGKRTCPDHLLESHFQQYNKEFLARQIALYNTIDYIICCGPKVEELFCNNEMLKICFGNDISIISKQIDGINCRIVNHRLKIIGFYHPQPPKGKLFKDRYNLLMSVVKQL